jgi:hypothetical protein
VPAVTEPSRPARRIIRVAYPRLRGRASLDLTVQTLDYRLAAEFWELPDFDDWVVRAIPSPGSPVCFSGAGFTPELTAAANDGKVDLVGLDELYGITG